jgi:hypothetical protein
LLGAAQVVFRTFFIFMWGTIFLGLFSGLAFAPIVLSLIGPLETAEADEAPAAGGGHAGALPQPPQTAAHGARGGRGEQGGGDANGQPMPSGGSGSHGERDLR